MSTGGGRSRHPKKEVETSLQYAENRGCRVEQRPGRGHAWGVVYCAACPQIWVWSTPTNPGNHAERIRKEVDRCLRL
ncbi:MAG: hypothetical protein M3072_05245 [Candidatus Dormibacteraeota bacterium]|nr:hypothetical protein [Candidatus Dormibacteraeota bacterium]